MKKLYLYFMILTMANARTYSTEFTVPQMKKSIEQWQAYIKKTETYITKFKSYYKYYNDESNPKYKTDIKDAKKRIKLAQSWIKYYQEQIAKSF